MQWLEKWPVNGVSGQRKLNTDGAGHWGDREAGFSPLTEVMGAVQQDDHAVHGEDSNAQQADRTHLKGKRSGDSEPYTDHSCNRPSSSLGVGPLSSYSCVWDDGPCLNVLVPQTLQFKCPS